MAWKAWLCLTGALRALASCDFEHVSADRLREGFEERAQRPLLIRGAGASRVSREAFAALLGDENVQVTRNVEFQSRAGTKPEAERMSFGQWLATLDSVEAVPYIFEFCRGGLCEKIESLGVPKFMKRSSMVLYLSAGKQAKGVAFHQHWQTWGLLLAGQKQWYVSPPGNTPRRPHRYSEEAELAKGVEKDGLQQCLQKEGEIVFLPKDWWHATFNKANWTLAIGGQGGMEGGQYDTARLLDPEALKKMSKQELQQALRAAAESGRAAQASALLEAGAAVPPRWSAVHEAAAAGGELRVLEILMKHGLRLSETDAGGKTFGHHDPSEEVLAFLQRHGVKLDAADLGGVTVAHEAAMRGHVGSLRLLREAGISLEQPCSNGATAGHFAAADGHLGVLKALSRSELSTLDYAGGTLAHHAASQGHLAALRFLLDEDLPAEPDVSGRTLMHEAAVTGYVEILDELRSRGYDPSAQDAEGQSVAQMAAEAGHLEILRQLAGWGAVKALRKEFITSPEVLDFLQSSEL